MSLHQTSVYVGTAGGGFLAGLLGEWWGWQSSFWVLGITGLAYAFLLSELVVEPKREGDKDRSTDLEFEGLPVRHDLFANLGEVVRNPAAAVLLVVFSGANFVAAGFLAWLTMYIFDRFGQGLARSSLIMTVFPLANLAGALAGGVLADLAARRGGGRMRVQGVGLILGAPFIVAVGRASTIPTLIAALIGLGICKGVYDANIFAALYDVVPPRVRGTAAGLMNTVGWAGGSLAPLAIGLGADRFGLGATIASTAVIYAVVGILALVAASLAARNSRRPGALAS